MQLLYGRAQDIREVGDGVIELTYFFSQEIAGGMREKPYSEHQLLSFRPYLHGAGHLAPKFNFWRHLEVITYRRLPGPLAKVEDHFREAAWEYHVRKFRIGIGLKQIKALYKRLQFVFRCDLTIIHCPKITIYRALKLYKSEPGYTHFPLRQSITD